MLLLLRHNYILSDELIALKFYKLKKELFFPLKPSLSIALFAGRHNSPTWNAPVRARCQSRRLRSLALRSGRRWGRAADCREHWACALSGCQSGHEPRTVGTYRQQKIKTTVSFSIAWDVSKIPHLLLFPPHSFSLSSPYLSHTQTQYIINNAFVSLCIRQPLQGYWLKAGDCFLSFVRRVKKSRGEWVVKREGEGMIAILIMHTRTRLKTQKSIDCTYCSRAQEI